MKTQLLPQYKQLQRLYTSLTACEHQSDGSCQTCDGLIKIRAVLGRLWIPNTNPQVIECIEATEMTYRGGFGLPQFVSLVAGSRAELQLSIQAQLALLRREYCAVAGPEARACGVYKVSATAQLSGN